MSAGERVMMTQETGGPGPASQDREDRRRGDFISVGGGDDTVVRIQLAARWAEGFAPSEDDSLGAMLRRFRAAYEYLDSVMHGIEPLDLVEPAGVPTPTAAPASSPVAADAPPQYGV